MAFLHLNLLTCLLKHLKARAGVVENNSIKYNSRHFDNSFPDPVLNQACS